MKTIMIGNDGEIARGARILIAREFHRTWRKIPEFGNDHPLLKLALKASMSGVQADYDAIFAFLGPELSSVYAPEEHLKNAEAMLREIQSLEALKEKIRAVQAELQAEWITDRRCLNPR